MKLITSTKSQSEKISNSSHLLCLSLMLFVVACKPRNTIPPYDRSEEHRQEISNLASTYCQQARGESSAQPQRLFTTDGCTWWPDGNWRACCVIHDIPYWCGGSRAQRRQSDKELKDCVNQRFWGMGHVMDVGVRFGGSPALPTSWRWGYGFESKMDYTNDSDTVNIVEILRALDAHNIVGQHLED